MEIHEEELSKNNARSSGGSLKSGGSAFKNSCQTSPLFIQPVINLHDKRVCESLSLKLSVWISDSESSSTRRTRRTSSSGANPLAIHRTVLTQFADYPLLRRFRIYADDSTKISKSKSDNYRRRFFMKIIGFNLLSPATGFQIAWIPGVFLLETQETHLTFCDRVNLWKLSTRSSRE